MDPNPLLALFLLGAIGWLNAWAQIYRSEPHDRRYTAVMLALTPVWPLPVAALLLTVAFALVYPLVDRRREAAKS